ncbi:MAG: Gfo/Idh/MocA family oxidoreductase [Armatimonadetes bacterium]|nr:Gfo/Idh/MocA family oxidoreductase [Armatimonadota bacterium]
MARIWRIGIVKDTSQPMLGLHGLHTAFRGLPNVEVVAQVDSNPQDLDRKLSYTQARRHYLTLEEMLATEALDIVVLCSRHPDEHLEPIRALAARGCHVYCEKPLSASLREADEMVELAARQGIRIAVAHSARYNLSFRTLRRMVAAGDIGQPLSIIGRGKCDHRGGGEDLMVLGTHILDLFAFIFGPPARVMAEVTTAGRPLLAGDRCETIEPIGPAAGDALGALFSFEAGVRGLFESRRGLAAPGSSVTPMGITVHGTAGSLCMRFGDISDPGLQHSPHPGWLEDQAHYEPVPLVEERVIPGAEPLDYALCGHPDIPRARRFMDSNRFAVWDLMRAIEEAREPECSVADARLVQEMIQGIYASALSRSAVDFPLTDRRHPLGEDCRA